MITSSKNVIKILPTTELITTIFKIIYIIKIVIIINYCSIVNYCGHWISIVRLRTKRISFINYIKLI